MVSLVDIKTTLVKITEAVNIPYCELWVNAGGGLVVHGLRETTNDIDAGCSSYYFHRIAIHYGLIPKELPKCNNMPAVKYISIPELNIDIHEEAICGIFNLILVNDVWTYDLHSLLRQKQMLGRAKDQKDIEAIKHKLALLNGI
jgi:hypothetical protein